MKNKKIYITNILYRMTMYVLYKILLKKSCTKWFKIKYLNPENIKISSEP